MDRVSECLAEWGVALEESEFVALLRAALNEIAENAVRVEPQHELPPDEFEMLRRGGFDTEPVALGADDPVLRGAVDLSALIATAHSTRDAATLLRVDPSRIRQRLTGPRPTLYGLKWRGEWLLPRFQFSAHAELPGLDQVIPRMAPQLSPVAVVRWFLSPSPDLVTHGGDDATPISPRAWLLAGYSPAEVARLAEAL